MHSMLAKIHIFVKACNMCQRTRNKLLKNRPFHPRIPIDYSIMEYLSLDIKFMPKGFNDFKYLLAATCRITNFVLAIQIK